jgi:hypothetical protein
MCPDGECVTDYADCSDNIICDENYGKGVSCGTELESCAKSLGDCYNTLNCRLDTPFRCPNGDCKRYPSKLGGVNGCDIGISCPRRTDPAKKNHPFVKVILLVQKINLIYARIERAQVRN